MCWTNFISRKHVANPLNILVHLRLLFTSQRLSVQSVAPSATVLMCFEAEFLGSPILGIIGVVMGRDLYLYQSKVHPLLSNAINTKFCYISRHFAEIPNAK